MPDSAEQKAAKKAAKEKEAADKAAQGGAADQVSTASEAKEVETQKIKFLRTHPNYAYWPGDEADLTAEHVEFLTNGGFAELVTEDETAE